MTADGIHCSSTKIREFLLEGRIEGAALLLGRPPEITGVVVRGAGRGRGLGFATANLQPEGEALAFRTGIYAARPSCSIARAVELAAGRQHRHQSDLPGRRRRGAVTVEAHLLDYPGADLYGARVRLLLATRLRDERRFDTVDELMAQIGRDVARTRELLG